MNRLKKMYNQVKDTFKKLKNETLNKDLFSENFKLLVLIGSWYPESEFNSKFKTVAFKIYKYFIIIIDYGFVLLMIIAIFKKNNFIESSYDISITISILTVLSKATNIMVFKNKIIDLNKMFLKSFCVASSEDEIDIKKQHERKFK